jgi:predicted RNA-binding protein with PIN domain
MREAEVAQAVAPPAAPAATSAPAAAPEPQNNNASANAMRADLSRLIAAAAGAADQLSDALAAAAQLLAPETPDPASPAESSPVASQPRHLAGASRVPLRLPPGITDDSVEAVEHLVRAPGALLLVDGYNISQAAWHQDPIARQRARLVDALAELHARAGIDIEVVFDGADVDRVGERSARPAVRVRFSAPGVEADDVVLGLVDAAPSRRPVIVASSDHRVRDGARRRGANVLGARQLLSALRR